jgi:hypothetical protein
MAYKYFPLSTYSQSPSTEMKNGFQALLNDQFSNATDVYTIQEERVFESCVFVDVIARVNRAINSYTSDKQGDDFKLLLFPDIDHVLFVGQKFYFDSNYWLVYNVEAIKNLASSATVRRCNNSLRWMDSNGTQYSEPCSVDYKISRPRDIIGPINPVLPQGYIDVYCQLNSRTKKIKGNQRFLFGPIENRVAFKNFGDGINNYLNRQTMDDSSSSFLHLSMGGNFVNQDTDNITLGIADYYSNYRNLNSGSTIGSVDIIATPSINYVLESGSALFDVRYYSGSLVGSGSFVFSISGTDVPTDHYVFATESANTFSLYNIQKYTDATLDVLCSGSSGSRLLLFDLKGAW